MPKGGISLKKDYLSMVENIVTKVESSDPFRICKYLDIDVFFCPLGSLKAYTTTNYRIKTIHINDSLNEVDAYYSCAHELGHILLKHDYNKIWMANNTFYNLNKFENDANLFAMNLLLYPFLDDIKNMEYPSNDNISRLTGIPIEYINSFRT